MVKNLKSESDPVSLTGHILAVDDEELLLSILTRNLEIMGFTVSPYTSSEEALHAFSQQPDHYDMLVTDNSMPGMSGAELVRQVKTIREDLPVLFITGNQTDEIDNMQYKQDGVASLNKPYDHFGLKAAVTQLLHGKS